MDWIFTINIRPNRAISARCHDGILRIRSAMRAARADCNGRGDWRTFAAVTLERWGVFDSYAEAYDIVAAVDARDARRLAAIRSEYARTLPIHISPAAAELRLRRYRQSLRCQRSLIGSNVDMKA